MVKLYEDDLDDQKKYLKEKIKKKLCVFVRFRQCSKTVGNDVDDFEDGCPENIKDSLQNR